MTVHMRVVFDLPDGELSNARVFFEVIKEGNSSLLYGAYDLNKGTNFNTDTVSGKYVLRQVGESND